MTLVSAIFYPYNFFYPFLEILSESEGGKISVGVILTVYFCCVSLKSPYMFILDTAVSLVLSTES